MAVSRKKKRVTSSCRATSKGRKKKIPLEFSPKVVFPEARACSMGGRGHLSRKVSCVSFLQTHPYTPTWATTLCSDPGLTAPGDEIVFTSDSRRCPLQAQQATGHNTGEKYVGWLEHASGACGSRGRAGTGKQRQSTWEVRNYLADLGLGDQKSLSSEASPVQVRPWPHHHSLAA